MATTARRFVIATATVLAYGSAAAAELAGHGLGRYDASLCVVNSNAGAVPNCGPAVVDLRRGGAARVRIDDIVYRLEPNGNLVDVVLMHNATQIDTFTSSYDWQDGALSFADGGKGLRYEVRLGKRQGSAR